MSQQTLPAEAPNFCPDCGNEIDGQPANLFGRQVCDDCLKDNLKNGTDRE